ncbi:MAG: T9SS type A sorting domain-containing protein [Bacteroidetes bacterium]|nr:T9SS type A sorting domain-containing protein [Bacteroidota bacterium]
MVIYPNPTSREITVNAEEVELNNLSVYNILGQNVIANITIKKVSKTELIIDLSQLKQGIYFIRTPNYSSIVTKQ